VKWSAGAITIASGYAVLDLTISGPRASRDRRFSRTPIRIATGGPAQRHEDRGDRRCGS